MKSAQPSLNLTHQMRHETRAAILARVSSPGQKDNSSLEGQLATGRAYCESKGYTIMAEKKEVMSGAFVLARSVFAELLDMTTAGTIQVIAVDVPDRLGRGDAISKLEYMVQLNEARVEYVRGVHDTPRCGLRRIFICAGVLHTGEQKAGDDRRVFVTFFTKR